MKSQNGFTLIELVVVIVILGILSAVAIPKFIDIREEARQASTEGIAGALSSAMAINYAARIASDATKGVAIAACDDIVPELQTPLPAEYTVSTTAITAGSTATCTVTHDEGEVANFVGIGVL